MKSAREILATRIKELREREKLSQQELASKIGFSDYKIVNRYENQESWPKPEILDRIAVFFDVPLSYLFSDLEQSNHHKFLLELTTLLDKHKNTTD